MNKYVKTFETYNNNKSSTMKNLESKIREYKNNAYENEFSIVTTAKEWINSSISWNDDLTENDDYLYIVNFIEENLHVTCIPRDEYRNGVANSDFSQSVTEYVDEFFQELIDNQEIFENGRY